jgi:hypothetical protein
MLGASQTLVADPGNFVHDGNAVGFGGWRAQHKLIAAELVGADLLGSGPIGKGAAFDIVDDLAVCDLVAAEIRKAG